MTGGGLNRGAGASAEGISRLRNCSPAEAIRSAVPVIWTANAAAAPLTDLPPPSLAFSQSLPFGGKAAVAGTVAAAEAPRRRRNFATRVTFQGFFNVSSRGHVSDKTEGALAFRSFLIIEIVLHKIDKYL